MKYMFYKIFFVFLAVYFLTFFKDDIKEYYKEKVLMPSYIENLSKLSKEKEYLDREKSKKEIDSLITYYHKKINSIK